MLKVGDRVRYLGGDLPRGKPPLDGTITKIEIGRISGLPRYTIIWDRYDTPLLYYERNLELLTPLELDWAEIWEE